MRLFNLFGRPARPAPVRRTRLFLEALAERWVPDGTPTLNDPMYLTAPIDQPPVITDFEAVELSAGLYSLEGTVQDPDEDPAGLTVTFHGPQSAIDGRTEMTGSGGHFEFVVQLPTDGTGSGTITAQAADRAGKLSNTASDYVSPTIR
jgi:hypothetical protein